MGNVTSNIVKLYIAPLFCLVFGIIFLLVGINSVGKLNAYTAAKATITRVDESSHYDTVNETTEYEYRVFVEFTVDGKTYNAELGEYAPGYTEGKEIDIKYNPENPNDIISASTFTTYLPVIIGVVALIIGIFFVIRTVLFHVAMSKH